MDYFDFFNPKTKNTNMVKITYLLRLFRQSPLPLTAFSCTCLVQLGTKMTEKFPTWISPLSLQGSGGRKTSERVSFRGMASPASRKSGGKCRLRGQIAPEGSKKHQKCDFQGCECSRREQSTGRERRPAGQCGIGRRAKRRRGEKEGGKAGGGADDCACIIKYIS